MSDTSEEPASPRHRSDPTPLADLDSRRSGLDPTIGARLTRRVVALGAESTGTTTHSPPDTRLDDRGCRSWVSERLRHAAAAVTIETYDHIPPRHTSRRRVAAG
jgi:hypothetical protein